MILPLRDTPPPTSNDTLLFDAAILPSWSFVGPFRRFIAELLASTCSDEGHVSRVAMTVHELLENAVKYGRGSVKVTVMLDRRGFASAIQVGTRTSPERKSEAKARIEELRASPNPQAHYLRLMKRAAEQKSSGLGLARVAVEAEMDLSCHGEGDGFVIVARPHPGASS